jgi:hypothetical protein
MGCFKSTQDNNFFRLLISSDGTLRCEAFVPDFGGLSDGASTTVAASANTWAHAAYSHSGTQLAVYIDGGDKTTGGQSVTPSGINRTTIGRTGDLTPTQYFDGRIGECGIWNVVLTDEEIAALARGKPPARVRPSGLVGYWNVGHGSAEPDRSGFGINLTVNGTSIADHAPVAPMFGGEQDFVYAVVAAAAAERRYHQVRTPLVW